MNKDKKILIPGLPSGFQDRWGKTLSLKKKLLKVIEDNYISYGYSDLETSPMELSSNIGNSLAEDDSNPMADIFTFNEDDKEISLRYDLSNPLARFYAQNYLELPNPYKRYQIGDVFRREKPGNGRFKSFGQCDADIIGKFNSAQANSELCNLIASTLIKCGLKKDQFVVNISNRKIVQGLMDQLKITDEKQKQKVLRAIDKLDKPGFGISGVQQLLTEKRTDDSGAVTIGAKLSTDQASEIINFLKVKDLDQLKSNLKNTLSEEGIGETEDLLKVLSYGEYADVVKFDSSKIRGLDIYTGFIVETNLTFEVKNPKGKVISPGSVCSGGEYLVSKFKGEDFLGTGISIGIDRLVFCLEQLSQIQVDENKPVIVCVMDEKYLKNYYEILKVLRDNNINSEIFLDSKKNLGKNLTYANKKQCPVAVICGENEFKDNTITLKNLLGVKGENNQVTVPKEKLLDEIKKFL
ncbi:histidine--tRNA ligase [Candidatus Pelagibacter giovannonii]|uniref:Histidine--tRNA ligase n=1 Tax=Candidatus Pelagibacter giovannonii TaxID=2563896 RepID=A0A6H1Q1X6_9PROT|nr:histidine--tRNA ligase [Candidatus Pelagibacter giovannonii]QIZ20922.1 histidine--tRNA ligase [Candidatus Pelagibacter giovannonii]